MSQDQEQGQDLLKRFTDEQLDRYIEALGRVGDAEAMYEAYCEKLSRKQVQS